MASLASAAILELTPETDELGKLLTTHDYTVISYFNSDEHAKQVDGLMEGAQSFFDKQIADGAWTKRDVQWVRVDIEKHPELALDDSGIADQLIFNNLNGLQRFVHFAYQHESKEDAERDLAEIVKELSGDWFEEIQCDAIGADDRIYYDEVVYFGDGADLENDEYGKLLQSMSMVDRYQYDQHRVGFFWNSDPACREANELDKDQK